MSPLPSMADNIITLWSVRYGMWVSVVLRLKIVANCILRLLYLLTTQAWYVPVFRFSKFSRRNNTARISYKISQETLDWPSPNFQIWYRHMDGDDWSDIRFAVVQWTYVIAIKCLWGDSPTFPSTTFTLCTGIWQRIGQSWSDCQMAMIHLHLVQILWQLMGDHYYG